MSVLSEEFNNLNHKDVLERLLIGLIESHWRTQVDNDCYHEDCDRNYLIALDRLFDYILDQTESLGFDYEMYEIFKESYLENVVRNR